MGAGSSHGDLAIQLETGSCFSGQEVSGIIHLFVRSPMNAANLYLRFRGKEKTAWTETRTERHQKADGTSESRTVTDNFKGKQRICNFSRVIYSWPQTLYAGQYSLPFAFILPPNAPSSFHYTSGTTRADIIYKFQAIVHSVSDQKIKGKTLIFVKQPAFSYNSNMTVNKSARMKTWCCVGKGYCNLSVSYPQDTYNPSQIASFYTEIDNSGSQLSVHGVTCRLFFCLRLKDNHSHTKFIQQDVIRENVYVNITPGSKLLQSSGVEIRLNLPSRMQSLSEMFSTKGSLIECMYTNEIKAEMEGSCMCCGDQPVIQTFMNIVPNLIVQPSAPVAPPDWHPQLLERIAVQYEPRYEIQPSAPEYMG